MSSLRYTGGGRFLVGVPARDLSAAEVKKYGGEEFLLSIGIYEKVAPKKAKSRKVTDNSKTETVPTEE
jgi:hypothetical protein